MLIRMTGQTIRERARIRVVELAHMRVAVANPAVFWGPGRIGERDGRRIGRAKIQVTFLASQVLMRRRQRETNRGMDLGRDGGLRAFKRRVVNRMADLASGGGVHLEHCPDDGNQDWRVRRVVTFAAGTYFRPRQPRAGATQERRNRIRRIGRVTRLATSIRVRTRQWKLVGVLEVGRSVEPLFLAVTRGTIQAELSTVNVGMAGLTVLFQADESLCADR
jgi:hypothetical protein